ncbi:MAG TPA: PKD domain-containing protein [Acidobacteriaceae bacterium]|jgi:hypothetical protein
MRRTLPFALAFVSLAAPAIAGPDDWRAPTANEQALFDGVNGAYRALGDVLLADGVWEVATPGGMSPNVMVRVRPHAPVEAALFKEMRLRVRPDSAYYASTIQPKMAAEQGGQTADAELPSLNELVVQVAINQKNVAEKPVRGALAVPGAYFAYRAPGNGDDAHTRPQYVLCFGDWSTAKPVNGYYSFVYKHPPGTPHIENIVVRLSGNESAIQGLLKNMVWNRFNIGDAAIGDASAPASASQPRANAGGPYTGTPGVPVTLDGSRSMDPDGMPLTYAWDLYEKGGFHDSAAVHPAVTFASPGTYNVELRVTNSVGKVSRTAISTVTITAPQ